MLASVCAVLMWIGGCPKRQDLRSTVVYVPAPAPAAAPAEAKPQVLVIEAPAPTPEPEETAPAQTPESAGRRRPRAPAHGEAPAEPAPAANPDNPALPSAPIPALEPRESSAQEAALRREIQRLHDDVRQRLARLSQARLESSDARTLEDARTFFAQSVRALEAGDLERALNLARKASLLVRALE